MSSVLKTRAYTITKDAFNVTFQGYDDERQLAHKFAIKFSTLFITSMTSYIPMCIGLPVGGPIKPGEVPPLSQSIYNCGKQAFIETFQGYDDENQLAHRFANELKNIAQFISIYVSTCLTVPAAPPTVPLSPGGLVIIKPFSDMEAGFKLHSKLAFDATFQNGADSNRLSQLFSDKFKFLAADVSAYISRCKSLPGGGPIIPA